MLAYRSVGIEDVLVYYILVLLLLLFLDLFERLALKLRCVFLQPFLLQLDGAGVPLVIGLAVPVVAFYLSSVEEPAIHERDALLRILLLLVLHLHNAVRVRLVEPYPLRLSDFVELFGDVLLD